MTSRARAPILALAVLAVVVFAGVLALLYARDGERGVVPAAPDPGPVHVHGLGVNPRDEALLIATHTGLYRVLPGERTAARVGERQQDTMGFTVVGPDHFLGSGHPDAQVARQQNLPPQLGLIASRDAGRSWRPVSLLGDADFHVLRAVGTRVYGFDVMNSRLLASGDGGKAWQQRTLPGLLIDLVAHPARDRWLLASTRDGLAVSSDDGRRWKPLGDVSGLLAWPDPERLYLVRSDGAVLASRDGGRGWRMRGSVAATPAAFMAAGDDLYVALHDGTIKRSADGGASWVVRSTP